GQISFYTNTASANTTQPVWQLVDTAIRDASNNTIDSFQFPAPLIYDINKDGNKDLLLGYQAGYVAYYKNNGTANQLALQHQNSMLGDVRADPWNFLTNYSVPFIGVMDNTGLEYLVLR